jgi:hypothetical protein
MVSRSAAAGRFWHNRAVWKHVIIEQPKAGCLEELEVHAFELWRHMADRGWLPYRAYIAGEPEGGEPSLFDLGVLRTAIRPAQPVIFYECEFPDRETLEKQLAEMRLDREVARINMAASHLVHQELSRSYIVEELLPSPRTIEEVERRRAK